ncbi:hypothetical protein ACFRMQ_00210 [Kitasatospora sp. NPDC056783]|uniref:hypothetical protein n=1 Tax=Kitasatospora sp. NPDC056783 TaxID=3345943 RepID=UPI0036ABEB89
MTTSSPADALALSLIENDWTLPKSLEERYREVRRRAGPTGPTAILAALDKLASEGKDPAEEQLATRLADARFAAEAVSHDQYISAPSTMPGVEGHRNALHHWELRRRVFGHGRDRVERHSDGSLVLRYPNDTFTTYHPATVDELEQFQENNRQRMEEVAAVGKQVRDALQQADSAVPLASRSTPATSGVDVHVGGGSVSVHWWYATWEEAIANRGRADQWTADGGLRDRVAELLRDAGIATEPDRDSLQVVLP